MGWFEKIKVAGVVVGFNGVGNVCFSEWVRNFRFVTATVSKRGYPVYIWCGNYCQNISEPANDSFPRKTVACDWDKIKHLLFFLLTWRICIEPAGCGSTMLWNSGLVLLYAVSRFMWVFHFH